MAFLGVKENKFRIPQLILHWGLPHRAPKGLTWAGSSGVTVQGHPDHGLPYLRARAILIYLATKQCVEGDSFSGSLAEINEWFDIDWPLKNLEHHFLRVVHAVSGCTDRCPCDHGRCQGQENRVAYWVNYDRKAHRFDIVLTEQFRHSMERGVWSPCAPVRRLVQTDQMAALDLFTFYMWRWQRMKCAVMETFGETGPFVFIKSAQARYRKRNELYRLHQRVAEVWPDCPFHVSRDGNRIIRDANRKPRIRRVCTQPARGRGRKPMAPSKRMLRPVRRKLQKRSRPFVCKPLGPQGMSNYRPDKKILILRTEEEIMAWVARNEERARNRQHE